MTGKSTPYVSFGGSLGVVLCGVLRFLERGNVSKLVPSFLKRWRKRRLSQKAGEVMVIYKAHKMAVSRSKTHLRKIWLPWRR